MSHFCNKYYGVHECIKNLGDVNKLETTAEQHEEENGAHRGDISVSQFTG